MKIDNRTARWLWLSRQGLSDAPVGAPSLAQIVGRLGFVQLDTLQVVARAHHHILWSRDQTYRAADLDRFAFSDRGAFEHFGHDASLFPMDIYPKWTRRFRQFRQKFSHGWYKQPPDASTLASVRDRIARDGPLCSSDFPSPDPRPKGMWARPPTKVALDHLWYTGELTTSHRVGFRKYYDLTERVIPKTLREAEWDDEAQIDWLCEAALSRLGFGTVGDIARFWDAVSIAEVKDWTHRRASDLVPIAFGTAQGEARHALMLGEVADSLEDLGPPTSRLRILNPFDPAIRDRKRLSHLFGFDYVNEMFVPKAKRRWGYYVYPILEGDRMIGRVDLSEAAKSGPLTPYTLWEEDGVRWTDARRARFGSELTRLARLRGA